MNLVHDHTHVRCQNLDATVDYFVKFFDGRPAGRGEAFGMPIVRLDIGGVRFAFSPKREADQVEPLTGKKQWGVYQLGFTVTDMNQALAELKAKGAEIEAGPVEINPSLTVAFIKAPDGIQVELLQKK